MNENSPHFESSNPFSTGGGGVTFEQLVGASYLVSLLIGDIPRGLDWGITKAVKFQHRWSGCLLDDAVITSTNGDTERKLALQVKHDLTFSASASNTTFARVIEDCWNTFSSSLGWQFNQGTDRIGIGLGVYRSKLARHFQPLLEWARTSKDSSEFLRKVSLSSFSSKEKQEYLQILRHLLSKSKGGDATDDETWKFLRCLVVIHFDIENPGSRDSVHCWNRLLDQIKNRDEEQAKLLFNALTSTVAEYARSAGSIDIGDLRAKIPNTIPLKDRLSFVSDLRHLRQHSDTVLESIHESIGNKVRLPRTKTIDRVEACIRKHGIVAMIGEPMVGKSVLLRLLASRLRSEGEIIALSVERLSGNSMENFLHNIHIQSDFQTILCAAGGAQLRCILIDGLEKATDEDRRRVLNDFITEIRKYNKSILSKGGHQDNCWKIVFSCRRLEAANVLLHLETRRNLADNSLKMLEVGSLTDEEVAEVVTQLPKLRDLASQGHLKEILSRPLVLDILTLPDISLPSKAVPTTLTETWLLEWFWKEVVRLAERLRPGRGNPDKREQLLIRIATQSLSNDGHISISDDMDSEAISGLVSDRLLLKEDHSLRFAHDVLQDWALTILLNNRKNDIPRFLIEAGEPLRLARAFRLHVCRSLELEQSPSTWLNLLATLEGESTLSPRWYQIALTAPLFSPELKEILPQVQPCLFADDMTLLSKFLKALRVVCVQPSPTAYVLFGDLPQAEFEKYLAYLTIPIREQWVPVIQLVLKHSDKLNDRCLVEFSYVTEKWMTNTEGNELFRKEIAELSLNLLNTRFLTMNLASALGSPLRYEEQERVRRNLVRSVLWAADCLPEVVDEFVNKKGLRDRDTENYGFEELILEDGWIPICKHLPKTTADILEAILCDKLEPDDFGSYEHLFMNLGIEFTEWNPPTYLKGPFLGLLRLHSNEGLDLIHGVTNHATECWKMMEELRWRRKPVPQTIKLKKGDIEVWGDEHVCYWYRYPSVAPGAITCSLMALEYWMNEQLSKGIEPQELFERVLEDTKSVAVVGVCLSVALANKTICREVVVPILENPVFWMMDIYRSTQDAMAESSINMLSTYFSLGDNKADYKVLVGLARQPHRTLDLPSFILPIMLLGPTGSYERLQSALRAFPENPPYLFEHEKGDECLLQERIEMCKMWAAQAERESYETFETGVEGEIGIRFKVPAELEEQQKAKLRPIEERTKLYRFQRWSMDLLDKSEVGQAFTIESAMKYAQDLARQDNLSYRPKNFLEDSEQRADAIAAFAAVLVICQWQWTEKNNFVSWCTEQLLTAAKRPEPPALYLEEMSRFSMGYRRSAARSLPILLLKSPKNGGIRKTIFALALHNNDEVRAYLFDGLKVFWTTDATTIWRCINMAIASSRGRAIDHKFWFLRKQAGVSVAWGKYATVKRLIKRMHKLGYLCSVRLCPRPTRKCSYREIDMHHLRSILYCLPSDVQIAQIPSVDKLVSFLQGLLLLTVNTYTHFEEADKHYNEWAHNEWNHLFFPIIANALLQLPKNIVERKLCSPILDDWEKAPAMMEEFLRQLSLVGSRPELEDKLVELWLGIGERVLSSDRCKSLGYDLNSKMRNVLGLLIFADPTGIARWKVQEWAPLKKMIPVISRWCDTVGHHPDCFPSLVRLLRTVGFSLMPEFGVGWLYDCIIRADSHKEFFERSRVTSSLAELLYDSWSKQELSIKQNPETLQHFAFLVDKVTEQGESIAVRLQSRLLGNYLC